MPTRAQFPQTGLPPPALFELMEEARSRDVDWRRGRVALYVHYAGEDVLAVAKAAYQRFFSENGLGLKAFPSLQKFEDDIVAWTGTCAMTPEGLMAAVVALRASLSEKIAELEEDPQWNTGDEREELVVALDELIIQAESLRDALQEA